MGFLPSKTTVGKQAMQYFLEFAQGARTVLSKLVKYKSKLNAVHFVVLSHDYFIFL